MIKSTIDRLKAWAKSLKKEIYTLYVAMRDPRTPIYAKLFAIVVVGYALSPIDLIPDFIPILGLLDDLILLPLGIAILRRMIPPVVMAVSRRQADQLMRSGLPASRNAAMIVVAIWALVLSSCIWWAANRLLYPRTNYPQEPGEYGTSTNNNQSQPGTTGTSTAPRGDDRSRSRER